jgi:hypothetical protein
MDSVKQPKPDGFRFWGSSWIRLSARASVPATKRTVHFNVSAFRDCGSEIPELAENHNAMPLGARFPFIRLFVFPALFRGQAEHGEIRTAVLSGFDFRVFSGAAS